MDWQSFYAQFYDMDEDGQLDAIRSLSRPGPAHELAELIAQCDAEAAAALLGRAQAAGTAFSPAEITDMLHCIPDEESLQSLVGRRRGRFTQEQFEELEAASFDEDFLERVARADGVSRSDGDYSPIPRLALMQELPPIRLFGLPDLASQSRRPKKRD